MITMPRSVADVCCNHQGSLATAEKMVQILATYCDVDVIKFQKRTVEAMSKEKLERPYTGPQSFGQTYGEHRKRLEFNIQEHALLKEFCEVYNKEYCCSVWDMQAAQEIVSLAPNTIKIPSAKNTDFEMIDWIKDNFHGEIHLSLGMTTPEEKHLIKKTIESDTPKRWVVYHCTSAYPCEFQDIGLGDFENFKSWLPEGARAGFSGHHKGIAIDIMAFALGATYIERHFTLDRTQKGTDHAASLEPEGVKRLVRDLNACCEAMISLGDDMKPCEEAARSKLK